MVKMLALSGAVLLASAGASLGMPAAPSPTGKTFALTAPPAAAAAEARAHRLGRAPHSFARATDGLFYVTAQVNGMPVRFIVDTGSNIVVLTAQDAARVGAAPTATGAPMVQTVGGATRMESIAIDRLEIAGQSLAHVEAATVEHGLDVSLLGQSALAQLESVRFAGDRVELN